MSPQCLLIYIVYKKFKIPGSDFAIHILLDDFQKQWLSTSDPAVGQVKDGEFKLPLKTLIFDFRFWNTLKKFIEQ